MSPDHESYLQHSVIISSLHSLQESSSPRQSRLSAQNAMARTVSLSTRVSFVFRSHYFFTQIYFASGILEVAGKTGITDSTPEINNLKVISTLRTDISLFWLLKDDNFLPKRSFFLTPPFHINRLRNSVFSGNLCNLRLWQPV